jgi:hypothetical protein
MSARLKREALGRARALFPVHMMMHQHRELRKAGLSANILDQNGLKSLRSLSQKQINYHSLKRSAPNRIQQVRTELVNAVILLCDYT